MTTPVKELKDRYGIGKQAEINRRKYLSIVPQKVDGVFCVDEEQLSLLDSLDEFLNSAPRIKMTDFPLNSVQSSQSTGPDIDNVGEATLVESSPVDSSESSLVVSADESDYMIELVETIAHAITPPNPIAHWERLAWLADNKIMITTKEVHQLAGAKPKNKKFIRGSFTFNRSGKIGGEIAWEVSKS